MEETLDSISQFEVWAWLIRFGVRQNQAMVNTKKNEQAAQDSHND